MFATGIPISLVLLSHQRYDVRSMNKTNEIDPSLALVEHLTWFKLCRYCMVMGLL